MTTRVFFWFSGVFQTVRAVGDRVGSLLCLSVFTLKVYMLDGCR